MDSSKDDKTLKHEEEDPRPPELSAEDLEGVAGGLNPGDLSSVLKPAGLQFDPGDLYSVLKPAGLQLDPGDLYSVVKPTESD